MSTHTHAVFRPEVLTLSAYHVPSANGFVKLDAMENPYEWDEKTQTQWLETLKKCAINRYPDPQAHALTELLKHQNHLNQEYAILLGNGSDEIIQLLLMALTPNSHVLSTTPSFVMYKQISDVLGLNYHGVFLNSDTFDLNLSAMLEKIEKFHPKIIFLAYPNNPTGNLFDENAIKTIIEKSTGLVIIDEAYEPFANASFMSHLADYSNLLVMRTVSKLGLAGLRLGYLAGKRDIIEQLNKIRLPYNINVLTQASVQFALENKAIFDLQTQEICNQRTFLSNELKKFSEFTVYESYANFILFKTAENHANQIFDILKSENILIKNMHPQGGLVSDCLRVTVGKPEENELFLNALKKALS